MRKFIFKRIDRKFLSAPRRSVYNHETIGSIRKKHMGKPYSLEMEKLPQTYVWAMSQPIQLLVRAVRCCDSVPLVVTGSGGSLTAAAFAAGLHQNHTDNLSKTVTPLEYIHSVHSSQSALMILSAGGKNPDILAVLRAAIARETRQIIVVCSRSESPLVKLALNYPHIHIYQFDLPTGRDGFLATNSLLAFLILLARAYSELFCTPNLLPKTYKALIHPNQTKAQFLHDLKKKCASLLSRDYLIVLHGVSSRVGALDIESKFTEAALGSIILSDYRNFGHGRHHWLAKRSVNSAVLALTSVDDRTLAQKTLGLIPKEIPQAVFCFDSGYAQTAIASTILALELTKLGGLARGLDPGRPGVPTFGRKIYNLKGFSKQAIGFLQGETLAIWRKTGLRPEDFPMGELRYWQKAYRDFVKQLHTSRYGGIVLDYDETLCDSKDREKGLSVQIGSALSRLLESGIFVGIATGRGKSVLKALRDRISPPLWSRVLVGYYNGAEIGFLNENMVFNGQNPDSDLAPLNTKLNEFKHLSSIATWEYRTSQISVHPKAGIKLVFIWDLLHELLGDFEVESYMVVRSGHSLDILSRGTSKKNLVDRFRQLLKTDLDILCIGDKGRWPGNDFYLLKERSSLSVDECSSATSTCWNLSPPGFRGSKATLFYLNALRINGSEAKIRITNFKR
jgi:hydroxymethylpyrimidine pyrophosphatase-like HAD family hydrolase